MNLVAHALFVSWFGVIGSGGAYGKPNQLTIATVVNANSNVAPVPPAGWTTLYTGSMTNRGYWVGYKVEDGTAAGHWRVTPGIETSEISVFVFNGASVPTKYTINSGTGAALVASSTPALAAGSTILSIYVADKMGTDFSTPAGMTKARDGHLVGTFYQSGTGVPGNKVSTTNTNGQWRAFQIGIEP